MRLTGAGAPGTIDADRRRVGFADDGDGHDPARLRRRRGRRRHGRRRRPADAQLGVASGWRASSSATSASVDRRSPRPTAARRDARRRAGAPARRPVFTAPAEGRRHRLARTTSSRASPSAPGWCCSASSLGAALRRAGDDRRLTVDSTARDHGRRRTPARDLARASCSTCTSPGSPSATRSSTRSSRSTRSAPAPARADGRRGARARRAESGRCTGCRSRSRTPTRSPAGGRRTARRCSPTTSPTPTSCSSSGSARAGVVPIGKTNVPEFAAGSHTFNTVFGTTLNPVDPTRSAGGSSAAAPRARWRPAWCRSPTAPTWAARCATRRRSAASSGCGRRSAGCRSGRSTTRGRPRRSAARWPATSATSRCCCR